MKRIVLVVLLLVVVPGARTATSQVSAPAAKATCVFSNPAFAGKCVENVDVSKSSSAKQACESVLNCLNSVGCLKTFCQATTVRTGWKLESAKAAAGGQ